MRYAIIADIHANLVAFRAVLSFYASITMSVLPGITIGQQ